MGKQRTLPARFPGKCSGCGKRIEKGETIHYDPERTKRDMIKHPTCEWSAPKTEEDVAKLTYEEARAELANASNGQGMKWNQHTGQFDASLDGELRQAARRLAYSLGWTSYEATAPGANEALRQIMRHCGDDSEYAIAKQAAEEAKKLLKTPEQAPNPTYPEPAVPAQPAAQEQVVSVPKADMNMSPAEMMMLAVQQISNGAMDENRVRSLIASAIQDHLQPNPVVKKIAIDLTKADGTKIEIPPGTQHKAFEKVLGVLACGLNLYLCGPAGAGKTTACENAAKALDVPFEFNGAILSKFELFGFKDGGGTYHATAFRRAFEHGGIYLADEIDAWSPQALLSLNAALANGYCDFPDGMVTKHESFLMVAAANTWGLGADRAYVGRNQLDAASLDRFVFLEFDYDEELERVICGNADWARRVQSIRKAVFSQKARMVVSPRASIHGAKLLQHFPQKEVEEMVIWKGVTQEIREKIENHLF